MVPCHHLFVWNLSDSFRPRKTRFGKKGRMDLEGEGEGVAAAVEVQQTLMATRSSKKKQLKLWVIDSYSREDEEKEKPDLPPLQRLKLSLRGLRGLLRGRREAAELASGALAGAMAKAVLAPLETVRTRMVVGVGSRSIPGAFAEIVREGGWQGLWAGNAINMLRIVPTQAIELATFEAVKRAVQRLQDQETERQRGKERDRAPAHPLALLLQGLSPVAIAGAAAGVASTLACHPLEVLKDRLTVHRTDYPSLGAAVTKIHADAGPGGFYAGLCPTLVGMLPYSTCYYFMYDTIKGSYCRARKKTTLSRPELLVVGALSGLTASTLSFPLEVARKRLMVGAIQGKCPAHMFAALAEVVQEEGVAGLYRGWGASCLKVMPTSGITWMFYEAWKDILLADKHLPHF